MYDDPEDLNGDIDMHMVSCEDSGNHLQFKIQKINHIWKFFA